MANPRQRRKVRSSSYKPVKQSKRANKLFRKQPAIKGPAVIQDAWDKRKTVRQNYDALGLAYSITPSGSCGRDVTRPVIVHGRQIADSNSQDKSELAEENGLATYRTSCVSVVQRKDEKIPRGFGRIIHDDSGAVVDVVLAEEDMSSGEKAVEERGLEHYEIENSGRQPERVANASWTGWLLEKNKNDKEVIESEGAKEVVQALEATSVSASKAGSGRRRTSSPAEMKYLTRLVGMYGRNYEAMAKDRKRNVNQYTAGRLRRAVEKAGLGPAL